MQSSNVGRFLLEHIGRLVFVSALLAFSSITGFAQWSGDPNVNTVISAEEDDQDCSVLASDGAGGVFIAWEDWRNWNYDIYVQRVSSAGVALWTSNGVAVCTDSETQWEPRILSDGSGGAIIVWPDYRVGATADIYAQRVNSSGVAQWTADGVAICAATGNQFDPQIVIDGAGGAIIAWEDYRNGANYDMYAQRINSSGVVQWTGNGVAISTAVRQQMSSRMCEDGAGGAIIAWEDNRTGGIYDIYSQRVNGSGVVQWTADGVAICAATGAQYGVSLDVDGAFGAIIAWSDERAGAFSDDIYAQRINSSGAVQWTANGVAICTASYDQTSVQALSDGSSGAFLTWADTRGTDTDIYAQRVNSSGTVQWTANGVAVSAASDGQVYPVLVTDAAGGVIIVWADFRNDPLNTTDVYAQRMNGSGVAQWMANGVAVSTASGSQSGICAIPDGASGAIIVWDDFRSDKDYDVYAEHLHSGGSLPIQLASFTATVIAPNVVRLDWMTLSEVNNYGFQVQRSRTNGGFASLPNSFIPGHGTTNEPHYYSFIDSTTTAGEWWYRLKQMDLDGRVHYSDPVSISTLTPVAESAVPKEFVLHQNYPNPFNPVTTINFSVPSGRDLVRGADGQFSIVNPQLTILQVYDLQGREVATLVNGVLHSGVHSATWNADGIASGIYIYKLRAGQYTATKKLILMK